MYRWAEPSKAIGIEGLRKQMRNHQMVAEVVALCVESDRGVRCAECRVLLMVRPYNAYYAVSNHLRSDDEKM